VRKGAIASRLTSSGKLSSIVAGSEGSRGGSSTSGRSELGCEGCAVRPKPAAGRGRSNRCTCALPFLAPHIVKPEGLTGSPSRDQREQSSNNLKRLSIEIALHAARVNRCPEKGEGRHDIYSSQSRNDEWSTQPPPQYSLEGGQDAARSAGHRLNRRQTQTPHLKSVCPVERAWAVASFSPLSPWLQTPHRRSNVAVSV
jgi:hypothetical protein